MDGRFRPDGRRRAQSVGRERGVRASGGGAGRSRDRVAMEAPPTRQRATAPGAPRPAPQADARGLPQGRERAVCSPWRIQVAVGAGDRGRARDAPEPPNFGLSRQLRHEPQSSRQQASQRPQATVLLRLFFRAAQSADWACEGCCSWALCSVRAEASTASGVRSTIMLVIPSRRRRSGQFEVGGWPKGNWFSGSSSEPARDG